LSMKMTTTQITGALGALAQETRLALFRLLVERGPDGLSAGTLAERLRVPPSSLSFHLRALEHAGLITQRRLSRQIIYAAEFTAMNAVVAYLTKNCCGSNESCVPVCEPGKVLAREPAGRDPAARARRR
jgi:ArsR family transcriptional regulator